jgi:hypothetical protein
MRLSHATNVSGGDTAIVSPSQEKSNKNSVWNPFKRVPNAHVIADGLKIIPSNWSITPVQDKSPKRSNWQTEEFIPHQEIARLILHGEKKISQKGNQYIGYWSGFGLRTGDYSNGILTIDVDGASAEPLLKAIANGELPKTVDWTSGKPGRYQQAYQMPEEIRPLLKNFKRAVLTEWGDLKTACDEEGKPTELLEFRYNCVQSVLPPSRHPQTGAYQWIHSPEDAEVAIAPKWLCDLVMKLAKREQAKEQEYKQRAVDWANVQRQAKYQGGVITDLVDFLRFEILPRLSVEQIFNWSGHNFREYGKTLKGNPPWRHSTSGSSFHTWWDGHEWAWQDKATGEGGGAVQYRWKLRGGSGTPKGKDFVEVIKELAGDAGVEMPQINNQNGYSKDWEEIEALYHPAVEKRVGEKVLDPDERLRLDLLALLKESDPIKRTRKRAEVCSNYRLSKSEIEDLLKVLSRRTEQKETKVYTLDELFALESEGLQWLIPELLPKGETIILAGAPKAGKTLLAIDAAFAIATGESSFLGEKVTQGKVLLVSCDESLNSTKSKLLRRGFRDADKDYIRILPQWTIDNLDVLEAQLEDFRPDVVIIDSLKRITVGSQISENSAEFADNIYKLKETIGRYQASGILIHHANKSSDAMGVGKLRGSSAIAGAAWGTWLLDHIPKPDPNNNKKLIIDPSDPRRVLSVFARDTEGQNLAIELNPEDCSWLRLEEEGQEEQLTVRERITSVLLKNSHESGLSGKQIIELLGMSREEGKGIYTELNRMVNKRLLSCKPASGDKRVNLYSLPNSQQVSQQGGDSPPPPPCVKHVDYLPESIDKYSVSISQQNSQQIVNNYSTTLDVDNPVDYLKLSGSNTSRDSQQLFEKQGGEGGVSFVDKTQYENKEILSTEVVEETPLDDENITKTEAQKVKTSTDPTEQPIKVGTRVRVVFPGSTRDGELGTVKKMSPRTFGLLAEVKLDNQSLRQDLRIIEIPVPGNEHRRLEVV